MPSYRCPDDHVWNEPGLTDRPPRCPECGAAGLPFTLPVGEDEESERTEFATPPPVGPGPGDTKWYAPVSSIGDAPKIPGYEILESLGRGGMGLVYRARQISVHREVALKTLLAGTLATEEELQRFRSEAEVLGRLRHPNIVQIYEVRETAGRVFFSMELVDGGSLADRLIEGPLPAKEAAGLVETVARAVQFAHERAIIHRDLKPTNVLTGRDGAPKVADFGLAKCLEATAAQTQSGALLGTPSYMAPEQASGETRRIGPWTDVYALGAILYECLTGRPPFRADSPIETALLVVHQEPVPVRNLQPNAPRDLETICMKCLAKEPGRRYPSAADLAGDLRRFLAGETILARPSTVWERAIKFARRRPAVAGLVAVIVVALAAVFTIITVKNFQLEVANDREVAARGRATRSFDVAFRALDRSLTRLLEMEISSADQSAALLGSILGDLLEMADGLAKDASGAEASVTLRGTVHLRIGDIHRALGRHEEAATAYREAADIATEAIARAPQPLVIRTLARTALNKLGSSFYLLGRRDDARGVWTRCLELSETSPADEFQRAEPADVLLNLALLAEEEGDATKAVELFDRALTLYRGLHEAASVPETARMLAQALFNIGGRHARAGRVSEAESTLGEALSVVTEVIEEGSEEPELLANVGDIRFLRGGLLNQSRRVVEAEKEYREGIRSVEAAREKFPSYARLGEVEAALRHGLFGVLAATFRMNDAEVELRKAVEESEAAIAGGNASIEVRLSVGAIYRDQGLLSDSKNTEEAKEEAKRYWETARDLLRGVVEVNPNESRAAATLGTVHYCLGFLAERDARLDLARENYLTALSHQRELVRSRPEIAGYRVALGMTIHNLSRTLVSSGETEAGLRLLTDAMREFSSLPGVDPQEPLSQKYLETAYGSVMGDLLQRLDYRGAMLAARLLGEEQSDNPDALFFAARARARCLPLIARDEALTPEDRSDLQATCSEGAIESLEKAIESGLPREKVTAEEADFAPLRDREDFRALLAE